MKQLKLVVFEEHNEAFFVWHQAKKNGWIASSGNTLIHIDEHSDWNYPRLTQPILEGNESSEVALDFSRNQLNIGNFIWPAIYQKTFDQVLWCKASYMKEHPASRMFIIKTNEHGYEFVTGMTTQDFVSIGHGSPSFVHYQKIPLSHQITVKAPVVISICLDFFSSWVFPKTKNSEIEISQREAEKFKNDPYHFLKLTTGSRVDLIYKHDQPFLMFNQYEYEEWSRLKVSPEEIDNRIDKLLHMISKPEIDIKLVTISRSRLSGYTPDDQWEFIEQKLIDKMSEIFDIKISSLADIA
jgi:hypothetical protein